MSASATQGGHNQLKLP